MGKFNTLQRSKYPILSGTINEICATLEPQLEQVSVMIDSNTYQSKPSQVDVARIKNTIVSPNNLIRLSVKELATKLVEGHSLIPAVLSGKGSAKGDMWQMQQVFMLDFDNKGETKLTLENVLQICENNNLKPAFAYETFSSTLEVLKFRLVFISNTVLVDRQKRNNLVDCLKMMFKVNDTCLFDTSCTDPARIFYGGRRIIYDDYEARINIDEIIEKNKGKLNGINGLKQEGSRTHNKKFLKENTLCMYENINTIKSNDVNGLRDVLQTKLINFPNYLEAMKYLTQQINLFDFLGIEEQSKFNCPFHDDSKPSAAIIYPSNRDEYFFYCHGCKTQGNIIGLTEIIKQCSRSQAIKFLFDVFQISIELSEQQKLLEENIRILMNGEFAEMEPEVFSVMGRYKTDLILIHNFVMDHIYHLPANSVTDEVIFYFSLRYFAKLINKSVSSVSRNVALISFLKLCRKLKDSEVPPEFLKRANKYAATHHFEETVQFYALPAYGHLLLEQSKERALEWKKNNCTMKGISKELIIRMFGEAVAYEVFPKQSEDPLSEKLMKFQLKAEKIMLKLLDEHKYATETQILSKMGRKSAYNETKLKRVIGESLIKYSLIRVRANKDLKAKFGIKGNGYPFIIIRECK